MSKEDIEHLKAATRHSIEALRKEREKADARVGGGLEAIDDIAQDPTRAVFYQLRREYPGIEDLARSIFFNPNATSTDQRLKVLWDLIHDGKVDFPAFKRLTKAIMEKRRA